MNTTSEIKSRIDIVNYISRYVPNLKKAGKDFKACCPFHEDRTPSFVVSPKKQTWRCYGACSDGGDIFSFAQRYHGWDFKEALHQLANESNVEIQQYQRPQQPKREQPTLDYTPVEDSYHCDEEKWQARAKAFQVYAEEMMWSDDSTGRDYLMARGFTEYSICVNYLGYNPHNISDDWGIVENGDPSNVWLPRGIVIPYNGEFAPVQRLRIRRLDWSPGDKVGKIIPPAGTRNVAWFNRPLIPHDIVIIVEGEFDAMILKQVVTNPRVVVMATGGTNSAKLLLYIAMLSLARKVIVAFDADDAGEKASHYWINALHNAVRLKPVGGKDINDMYLAGIDLNQWIFEVLS